MIDEARTLELFGYTSNELSKGSHKHVIVVCDECGVHRDTEKRHSHRNLCMPCKRKINPSNLGHQHSDESKQVIREKRTGTHLSDKTKDKLRVAHKGLQSGSKHPMFGKHPSKETLMKRSKSMMGKNAGDKHPMFGKHCSEKTKHKLSEANTGINHPQFGKKHSEQTRRRQSATLQGMSYDDWERFAETQLYCPKFDMSCKESNREKYSRRCFLCKKTESENGKRLSVHHVDMNKAQGCDGHTWKLIPVCASCHGKLHSIAWDARITYLLEHVWR